MKFKKLMTTVLAGTIAVALAACSGGTGNAPANSGTPNTSTPGNNSSAPPAQAEKPDPITIQYWHSHAEAQMPGLEYMIEEFHNAYPHITVEPVYQGAYDDLHKKLQAAVAARKVPAVSNVEVSSLPTFADSGVFANLDPYIERDGVDTADFSQGMLQAYQFNDSQYGLPLIVSTSVFVYNKTMLDELGATPPQTWDEIPAFFDKVVEKQDGKTTRYGFAIGGWDPWYYDPWIINGGGSIVNEDFTDATVGTGDSMKAWNNFKQWLDDGNVHFGYGQGASGTMRQMFYDGQLGMVQHTSAMIKTYIENASFEVGVSFLPGDVNRISHIGGAGIVLMEGASEAEKEAGWKFIEFMTSAEHNIQWAEKVGYLPTRKSAIESEVGATYLETWPQYSAVLDLFDNVSPRPKHPAYPEFRQFYMEVMGEMILNGANPADLLPQAEEEMEDVLASY